MAIRIGSNIASLIAQRYLAQASSSSASASEKLSSGLRINRASDDAAGLAISQDLQADARVYNQGMRNIQDGLSLIGIVEGALRQLSGIAIRQLELAEQAANGVYSSQQRSALNSEANALVTEYNRIITTVEFNDIKPLDNTLSANTEIRIQAGYGLTGSLAIRIGDELGVPVGDGTFQATQFVNFANNAYDTEIVDLNEDGKADIITNSAGNEIQVLIGNGDGSFAAAVTYRNFSSILDFEIADIDLDGNLDLVSANPSTGAVVMLGNGNGTLKARVSYPTPLSIVRMQIADFNGDGKPDLATLPNSGAVGFYIQLGNGNGSFSAAVAYDSSNGSDILAYDFDRDGDTDIVLSGGGAAVRMYLNNGNGTFAAPSAYNGNGIDVLVAGDLNGDGKQDLIGAAASGVDQLAVLIGNGNGTFKAATCFNTNDNPRSPRVADFNGDNILDLVVGYDADLLGLFLGNGNGTFKAQVSYVSGLNPRGLSVGDLNGDGVSDVIAANYGETSLGVYITNSRRRNTISALDLTTQAAARNAISEINATLRRISNELGALGGIQARLDVAFKTLATSRENFIAADARITNADIAEESANLVRSQIQQKTAVAILGQANQEPAIALLLLRDA